MGIVNAGQMARVRRSRSRTARGVEDIVLNRRAGCGRAHGRVRRTYAVKGGEQEAGRPRLARQGRWKRAWRTRWCTASPTASSRTPRRRAQQARGRPLARDRRAADGRHERGRRPVRLGQDVPAAGGQIGARDEAGGRAPDAVYGSEKQSGAGGSDGDAEGQDRDRHGQGRRPRHRQEHRRRGAPVQQLRGHRSRRDGAGGARSCRWRREEKCRHHRPVRADHALARRDVPRRAPRWSGRASTCRC